MRIFPDSLRKSKLLSARKFSIGLVGSLPFRLLNSSSLKLFPKSTNELLHFTLLPLASAAASSVAKFKWA